MNTASYWDGKPFDRILCDAPCSATGVIRRHPDIKLLRQQKDISANAALQRQMLNALWPLLKRDGVLLYVTCSILPEENASVIKNFLSLHEDAQLWQFELPMGAAAEVGWQILPNNVDNCDGFYYARLRKQ
jgi:16S rRNA (cytosine967-C5)-methyltransferase